MLRGLISYFKFRRVLTQTCGGSYVPEKTVMICESKGKFKKLLKSGDRIPFFNQIARIYDLRDQPTLNTFTDIVSKDGILMKFNLNFVTQVIDPIKATYDVQDIDFAASQMIQTVVSKVLGRYTFQDILHSSSESSKIEAEIETEAKKSLEEWGISIKKVSISQLQYPIDIANRITTELFSPNPASALSEAHSNLDPVIIQELMNKVIEIEKYRAITALGLLTGSSTTSQETPEKRLEEIKHIIENMQNLPNLDKESVNHIRTVSSLLDSILYTTESSPSLQKTTSDLPIINIMEELPKSGFMAENLRSEFNIERQVTSEHGNQKSDQIPDENTPETSSKN